MTARSPTPSRSLCPSGGGAGPSAKAAAKAEEAKEKKYAAIFAETETEFVPFGMTTFATFGPQAGRLLGKWAMATAGALQGDERQTAIRQMYQRVVVAVMRAVAARLCGYGELMMHTEGPGQGP